MKRLLFQGLKFFAVGSVLYLLSFFVLTHVRIANRPLIFRTSDYYQWKGGLAYAKFQEWDPGARWDAIVIGSSHAQRGYDPRTFRERGYRMFNMGSTAQTPLSTYAILDHYVTRERTGLVIIDLYETPFLKDGLESVSDLTQNMTSDAAAAELAASLRDVRALNMFTLRMMNKNGPAMYKDPTYTGSGFAAKPDSVHGTIHYDVGRPLVLDDRQKEYFEKCLDLCAQRGLRVVLVTHYYPHQSDSVRHDKFRAYVNGVIADFNAKATGTGRLHWFDFAYTHHASDTDHFFDYSHVNAAGARLFSEQLLDSLVSSGYLPTR
ncbi:MAG: hypothetical protein ABI432_12005 [Flavobacteriales bacterium]